MPRYLVEGSGAAGAGSRAAHVDGLIERNLMASVTWICSFVGDRRTYAIYEGPHPEAVRRAAGTSGLEVVRVDEVRLLDPYAYLDDADALQQREEMR